MIPIKKLTVITLNDNEPKLIESIGELGLIQLHRLDDSEFVGFNRVNPEEIRKFENTYEQLNFIRNKLSTASKDVKKESEDFNEYEKTIKNIDAPIEEFEKRVISLREKVNTTVSRLKELKEAKFALQIFKTIGFNPKELAEFKNIFIKLGLAKSEDIPSFRLRLKNKSFITFKEKTISPKESFLYVSGLIELKPWIEKLLSTIGFREFRIIEEFSDETDIDIKRIDNEIKELEGKIPQLEENYCYLNSVSKFLRNIQDVKSYLLKSKTIIMLQGWVPENKIERLKESFHNLNDELNGTLYYSLEDPLPYEEIPTVMENPKLFGPGELLTTQFGCPESKESDPTIISTILWMTMFGIMFPDFGQGLVILGLGIILSYVIKKPLMEMNFNKLGRLIMGLGISAIIFGLLTGGFFLTEVHPLWPGLMPNWVTNPNIIIWLIKIAVYFGIAQIILGLIISIKNHIKSGDKIEALFGDRGLAGLVTFIGIVLVASYFLGVSIIPGISFPKLKLDVITHWPIAIPLIGVSLIGLKAILKGEEPTMILGLIIETMTSSLSNVLSYARIAGFCVAHATFALIIVKLFQSNPMLGIGLGLIFLNIFCLTLELLVVMIQSLRLLYYEFSTKFFQGTGTPYAPYGIGEN